MNSVQNKRKLSCKMALLSYCTCRRADARGTLVGLNGFKCRIQFQDELVEITEGNVEIRVTMVVAGFRETGMLIDCLLRRVQADSLTHSQNVIGYHVGHAFSCRHLIRRAHRLLGLPKTEIQWREISYNVPTGMKASLLSSLQNRPITRFFPRYSCS